jgi:peptidoglycan-associated lipoprotein
MGTLKMLFTTQQMHMKWTKFVSLLALLATLAGTGCKRNPQGTTPLPGYGKSPVGAERPGGMIGDAPGVQDPNAVQAGGGALPENLSGLLPDPNQPAELRNNTVYFAYDSADIRAGETSKLEAIASYMKSGGSKAIRIEGHCDERGTEEYNRALGERRALAARERLVAMGVSAAQIDTRTMGEDNPAVPGHNDAAWSKNRRAEFILLQVPGGVGATTNP